MYFSSEYTGVPAVLGRAAFVLCTVVLPEPLCSFQNRWGSSRGVSPTGSFIERYKRNKMREVTARCAVRCRCGVPQPRVFGQAQHARPAGGAVGAVGCGMCPGSAGTGPSLLSPGGASPRSAVRGRGSGPRWGLSCRRSR